MHFIDLGADLVADYGGGMTLDELTDQELERDWREAEGDDDPEVQAYWNTMLGDLA